MNCKVVLMFTKQYKTSAALTLINKYLSKVYMPDVQKTIKPETTTIKKIIIKKKKRLIGD